jgi:hypothetical protein
LELVGNFVDLRCEGSRLPLELVADVADVSGVGGFVVAVSDDDTYRQ